MGWGQAGNSECSRTNPPFSLPKPSKAGLRQRELASLLPGPGFPARPPGAPTFGVEVHAQPGAPTLALRTLQVLPDKHILHFIQNGQDCPTRWTQGRPMSGQAGLPGVTEPPE
jgi:hypothetical protein